MKAKRMNLEQLHQQAKARACQAQAEMFSREAATLLADMIALVGVNRMDELMRVHGFSVEPDQKRRVA